MSVIPMPFTQTLPERGSELLGAGMVKDAHEFEFQFHFSVAMSFAFASNVSHFTA